MNRFDARRQLEAVCWRLRTHYNDRNGIRNMQHLLFLFRCARAEYLGE